MKYVLAAVAASVVAAAVAASPAPKPGAVYKVGDRISNFTFKGDNGRSVSLAGLKGKVVVIDFFATW